MASNYIILSAILISIAYSARLGNLLAPNIDYQLHSFNDLKEFPQILTKGARRFKFDPHYVANTAACHGKKDCLLLNHDTPLPGKSAYNSSDDLLDYLGSGEFEFLRNGDYVSIALCFKSAPNKCKENNTDFNRWLDLVEDFFDRVAVLNIPNVEFILDGDAKPQGCLVDKWKPWNSVWIVNDCPNDAFYSDSLENDFYRFQVLNNKENVSNWKWMAGDNINYGKFAHSSYAYQLWEPDSQSDFQEYIDIYRSGAVHEPGYDFAINIDMAMFWIYSHSTVGTVAPVDKFHKTPERHSSSSQTTSDANTAPGINQLLDSTGITLGAEGTPFIAELTSSSSAPSSGSISLTVTSLLNKASPELYSNLIHSKAGLQITTSDVIAVPTEITKLLNNAQLVKLVKLESLSDSLHNILLIASDGSYVVSQVVTSAHSTEFSWEPVVVDSGKVNIGDSVVLDAAVVEKNPSSLRFLLSSNDEQSSLVILTTKIFKQTSVVSVSLPLSMSKSEVSSGKLVELPDQHSVLVFVSLGDFIHVTTVFLDETETVGSTIQAKSRWVLVTVGRNFDVQLTVDSNNQSILMLVNDFGYCYNSHVHNTRSYPMVCSTIPTPTAHVLDYSVGFLDDWLEVVSTSSCTNSQSNTTTPSCVAIDSCHSSILHGSFDQGSYPALLMQTFGDSVEFLELHNGLQDKQSADGACGEPIHRNGIVVDSFDINGWLSALRRIRSKSKQ